jgi:putative glutathione S-transferase
MASTKQWTDPRYQEPTDIPPLKPETLAKVRPRPDVDKTEMDASGAFVRQTNLFTTGFGPGKNPVEKGRYRLIWAKGCNWSNRIAIVRELLGLEDAISINMVNMVSRQPVYGWEFVYDQDHTDPVLGVQLLSELYENTLPGFRGRATVPSLVDVTTKTVANNDYHHLTNYLEVDFKDLQKPNAPDLYPEELREEIDSLNWWLFDNVNNGVYRAQFARSISAYDEAIESFYAALEQLDQRLADRRFLLGDYVTDSDVRLYTTLARLDIAYAQNLGPLPKRLVDFPNLWPYARDLYQIPAFKHNTYFRDFGRPQGRTVGGDFTSYYARFIDEIDFEGLWGAAPGRAKLSGDPANKFKI